MANRHFTIAVIIVCAAGLWRSFAAEGTAAGSAPTTTPPAESINTVRSYNARGVIVDLPPGGRTVFIRHEAIAGLMPAMTMEFAVPARNALRDLNVGETITFTLRVGAEESWIEGLRRAGAAPPKSDSATSVASLAQPGQLKTGDPLPDAELVGEDGHPIRFSDFRGRVLAFTFIFTRCPLPDFCPRMNRDFKEARSRLLQLTGGPTNWQFLSISFDPDFDQPEVLRTHATVWRDENPDRWLFAAAPTKALAAFAPQLDFRYANAEGTWAHNLRTVVLDPQGRIHRQFAGNQWSPEGLAQTMIEAAATQP